MIDEVFGVLFNPAKPKKEKRYSPPERNPKNCAAAIEKSTGGSNLRRDSVDNKSSHHDRINPPRYADDDNDIPASQKIF